MRNLKSALAAATIGAAIATGTMVSAQAQQGADQFETFRPAPSPVQQFYRGPHADYVIAPGRGYPRSHGYGYGRAPAYGYYEQPYVSPRVQRKRAEFEARRRFKEQQLWQRGEHPAQLNPYYYHPRPRYYHVW